MSLACVRVPLGSWNTLWDSCQDEVLLCAVLRDAYVGCRTAVGNGKWNGAVEDSSLDLVVERVTFGDVVDPLVWG